MQTRYDCHFCGKHFADKSACELHECACGKGLKMVKLDINTGDVAFERVCRGAYVQNRISIGICNGKVSLVYDPCKCTDEDAVKKLVAEVLRRHKEQMAYLKGRIEKSTSELDRLVKSTKVLQFVLGNRTESPADTSGVTAVLTIGIGRK